MAINIKFDLSGNPEPPTIILATKNGNKLGQLDVNQDTIDMSDKFNDASEFSFTLNKYYFDEEEQVNKITNLWDKVVNFKLVYCEEWDMWFEITVELDEETETVKTVFCTQLGQAELSQIMLYNIEINTEEDIARDDYKITILYDENDKEASLLHRLLKDKAPHYSVKYVDPTIAKLQRSFSFNDTSIYDAFMDIAEEIGCLFLFHSNSDENGKIQRIISVYDLQQNCLNPDCKHRGEFIDKCPKCSNTDIKYGYGEDTLIFVTSDELASAGIKLTTDTDAIKNCFKLETGDDLMTATVRNCNPNGTDYIWRFSDDMKSDMSEELVNAMSDYDLKYDDYYANYESIIDSDMINKYNALVEKYNSSYCLDCGHDGHFKDECPECKSKNIVLQLIPESIKGYSTLMNAYYNVIDLSLYLESALMPSIELSETNAKEQIELLESSYFSTVAVSNENIASVSLSTANSAVLSMVKIIIEPTYKVEIGNSEYDKDTHIWSGNFIITNYSDDNDTAESNIVEIEIDNDIETFVKQKIDKALNKEDTDDYSISGLFKKEYDEFCEELKKYALNPLKSFYDACDACLNILIEQGAGNKNEKPDLYENLYEPYYQKSSAISNEIALREDEVNLINGIYDENGNLVTKGIRHYIEDCRKVIQDALNFQNNLGEDLWLEFCCYRREDKYSNDNYISDGLNNAELFKKAFEFFEIAENEIYKASESQHSISTTLNNLFAIPKFKSLVKFFNTGNWIRVQIDDEVYKLRLLEYEIGFGDFDNIPVEFSDVTKIKNGITDVQNTLKQASSMASSYSSIKRQASQGEKGNATINSWVEDGLNTTNTKIVSGYDESLLFDKNGFWCRQIDPDTGESSDEQIKIFGSTIAITDDKWNTTKTAIGRYYYIDENGEEKMAYGVNGETIIGKFILGENLSMQNESGGMKFDGNGLTITSGTGEDVGTMTFNEDGLIVNHGNNTVTISPKTEEVINITNGEESVFNVDESGELSINGNIIARSLRLENGVTIDSGVITNLSTVATSGSYNDLVDAPTKLSDFDNDNGFVTNDVSNLTNYYNKTESNNLLNSKVNSSDLSTVATTGDYNNLINTPSLSTIATSGSYNDLVDVEDLKNWVLEQIQLAVN